MDARETQPSESLAGSPWNHHQNPGRWGSVPAMLTDEERRMLYWLARYAFTGRGAVCDLGAFLGGSTLCLAAGLRDAGWKGERIHSYDLFELGPFEQEWFRTHGLEPPPDRKTLGLYRGHVDGYLDLVTVHEGDVRRQHWAGGPIELLFVDLAKTGRTWDHVLREFFPALTPGVSLVVLQDYLFADSGPWHHVTMEKLSPYFEYVADTGRNSAVFRYARPVNAETLRRARWAAVPDREKHRMMRAAIARMDSAEKQEILRSVARRIKVERRRERAARWR